MIRKKVFAVLASGAAAVATIGVGGAAHAANDPTGHYHSSLSALHCTGVVLGHPDGGTLSAQYSAWETRMDVEHFRGDFSRTHVLAQVQTYNGHWRTVERSRALTGTPGGADVSNGTATQYFVWGNPPTATPRLSISVRGTDDFFRIQVRTRIYSDEGARLAYLKDSLAGCRI